MNIEFDTESTETPCLTCENCWVDDPEKLDDIECDYMDADTIKLKHITKCSEYQQI